MVLCGGKKSQMFHEDPFSNRFIYNLLMPYYDTFFDLCRVILKILDLSSLYSNGG